ncbi:MAG: hypothetical protein M3081_17455 [Gemmatimonadota bacterium]|nr:hypothetical protein [Gemmatimonadota bacterium]
MHRARFILPLVGAAALMSACSDSTGPARLSSDVMLLDSVAVAASAAGNMGRASAFSTAASGFFYGLASASQVSVAIDGSPQTFHAVALGFESTHFGMAGFPDAFRVWQIVLWRGAPNYEMISVFLTDADVTFSSASRGGLLGGLLIFSSSTVDAQQIIAGRAAFDDTAASTPCPQRSTSSTVRTPVTCALTALGAGFDMLVQKGSALGQIDPSAPSHHLVMSKQSIAGVSLKF